MYVFVGPNAHPVSDLGSCPSRGRGSGIAIRFPALAMLLPSKEGNRFSCHLSFHDAAEQNITLGGRHSGKHVIQTPAVNMSPVYFDGALLLRAA
jgi:hypothetical protein